MAVDTVVINAIVCLLFVSAFVAVRIIGRHRRVAPESWRTYDKIACLALCSFLGECALNFTAGFTVPLSEKAFATPSPDQVISYRLLFSELLLNSVTAALTRTSIILFTMLLTSSRLPRYYLYATPVVFLLTLLMVMTSCMPLPLSTPLHECPRFRSTGIASHLLGLVLNTAYILPAYYIFKQVLSHRRWILAAIPGTMASVVLLAALGRTAHLFHLPLPGRPTWMAALIESAAAGSAVAGVGCIWVVARLGDGGRQVDMDRCEAVLQAGTGHNTKGMVWERNVVCETVDMKERGYRLGEIGGELEEEGIRKTQRVEVVFSVV